MKSVLIIFLLATSTALMAQSDETLFDDVNRVGAFGGPMFEYTNLDKELEVVGGGGGALVLDDFFLGGYGMGRAEYSNSDAQADRKERVNFKHGGFWLGYTPMQRKVLHPYAALRFGWGKARYKETDLNGDETFQDLKDNLFVMTPEVGIELNIFSFFRIAATGTYRLVNGVDDVPNYSNKDFSSFGATLTFRFGGFGSWN